jgi:hypothetical protein
MQDPEQSRTIYRLALDLIIHSPNLFIKGAFHNWTMFFSDSWYSAFSFLGGENGMVYKITRWTIYTLCVLGFMKWLLKPSDQYSGLVAMAALGVLASVPFVPPTDAYRVRLYAASIVIFGLLPSMGLSLMTNHFRLKLISQPNLEFQELNVTAIFSALLVIIILGGTLIAKASSQLPPTFDPACPAGSDKILVRFDAGTSINIMREKSPFLDWMPNFHKGLFNRNIHSLADIHLVNYLESLTPYISIFSSVDYLSNQQALIIIQTDLLPPPGTYIGICGQWETDPNLKRYDVFIANDVKRLVEK